MKIKVELCERCAYVLRCWLHDCGPEAMAAEVGPTLRACATCRGQLPPGSDEMVTQLKQPPVAPPGVNMLGLRPPRGVS